MTEIITHYKNKENIFLIFSIPASGPCAEILKGRFYFDLVGNPRCGDLGV